MKEKNIRLFQIVDDLKRLGYIPDDTAFAESIGESKQSISHLRNSVKKINIDLLESIKKIYPSISLLYIVMGEGGFYDDNERTSNEPVSRDKEDVSSFTIRTLSEALREANNTIAFLRNELERKELERGLPASDVGLEEDVIAHIG